MEAWVEAPDVRTSGGEHQLPSRTLHSLTCTSTNHRVLPHLQLCYVRRPCSRLCRACYRGPSRARSRCRRRRRRGGALAAAALRRRPGQPPRMDLRAPDHVFGGTRMPFETSSMLAAAQAEGLASCILRTPYASSGLQQGARTHRRTGCCSALPPPWPWQPPWAGRAGP
jgi:hypothetical protein